MEGYGRGVARGELIGSVGMEDSGPQSESWQSTCAGSGCRGITLRKDLWLAVRGTSALQAEQ